ncbi:hypothetical protein JVX98_13295 [Ensifer sp. PDNC004]|uniref:hypothetical protein n=1 Tax=Ensifer sp. PDNC004 TaxID=2811423 RepID=UPI0019623F6A|nr:hypothetical protein [Ensifer sp. PDNC004]QRY69190.1 hypothetical protein JVX98_13295 [Ensifer sp. PDNC004]
MNEFAGYTKPVPGGHWGMLRFAKDGQPNPIMGPEDKPMVFPTELEALRAVNAHLLRYFNGTYLRCGVKAERHAKAESLFPTLRPRKVVGLRRETA